MKRKWIVILGLLAALCCPVRAAEIPDALVAVGRAVGIDVKCGGLLVVGFSEDSPARESGLKRGDLIVRVDGEPVSEPGDLRNKLQDKTQVTLTASRGCREQSFLVPLRESGGVRTMGASVKTEMAGIGTVTFYDPATAAFGALGHGITEDGAAALFPVRDGFLCRATVVSAEKGRAGAPGMLQGAFDSDDLLGVVTKNTDSGIFGELYGSLGGQVLEVGDRREVVCGPAEILCNVEGDKVDRFQAEIQRVYDMGDSTGRNMLIRVTDQRLLDRTGGIVQGMSGSPILQNGKLVGAVTHVLVADPEVGYGIFIETMLDACEN